MKKNVALVTSMIESIYKTGGFKLLGEGINNAFAGGEIIDKDEYSPDQIREILEYIYNNDDGVVSSFRCMEFVNK